ncbi:ABC transporter family substrate-binding protein [Nonomuraea sp. SBT364]|uniref:ABC transporter family substrate-binding protein n=1 Tax=Nonomuraea sp. SBT364 TaxID=1580530 RepID=UPI000ACB78E2|nr:ABC transporter family substrate-binding protein [Nonomuraea sp. SBT364]
MKATHPVVAAVAAVAAVTAALSLAACGGGGAGRARPSGDAVIMASDLNPMPRDRVGDGGTLRWGVNEFPAQWNRHHVDGHLAVAATISDALLPRPFVSDDRARMSVNRAYLIDARVTATTPKQVVTYKLNPLARWSDGKPVTWADYRAQWQALDGGDPAFHIASSTGYQDIEQVARGRDDYEVVVTFARPFGDWQALFGPLLPASANATPEAFDTAWLNRIPVTAGPFKVESLDQTAKTVTLVRDDSWWGDRAKLDRIVFRAAEQDSLIGMFGNGELDLADIGPSAPDHARAAATPGAEVRQAAAPDFRHFTLNGSRGPLRDIRVRQAVQLGLDREAIARSDLRGLDWPSTPLNSHFFMNTQQGYRDNAGELGVHDPARAGRLLDEAGWRLDGSVRRKDGHPLELRFVVPSGVQLSKSEGELAQSMLARIGMKLTIQAVPSDDFFAKYVIPGNFDIAPFAYIGTPFPVSSNYGVYAHASDGKTWNANFGRTGSAAIDAAMARAARSLDPLRARAEANTADRLIWKQVNVLPLYQRPQLVAARQNLANAGARGFQMLRYQDMGFSR